MGLESGTTVSSLRDDWPLADDPVSAGENHIQLIKQILKDSFTGGSTSPGQGRGLAGAVTATHAELNATIGATSNLQQQIDALTAISGTVFPSGFQMLMGNLNAIPVGFYYYNGPNAGNDSYIRITTASSGSQIPGTKGGVQSTITPVQMNHSHGGYTGYRTLTLNEMPTHSHYTINSGWTTNPYAAPNANQALAAKYDGTGTGSAFAYQINAAAGNANVGLSSSEGGSSAHRHTISNSVTENDLNFIFKYVNAGWIRKT